MWVLGSGKTFHEIRVIPVGLGTLGGVEQAKEVGSVELGRIIDAIFVRRTRREQRSKLVGVLVAHFDTGSRECSATAHRRNYEKN